MKYCRLEVRTNNGVKVNYIKFEEEWKLGKHLLRYYKDKEYSWEEILEENLQVIRCMMGISKFNKLKWTVV